MTLRRIPAGRIVTGFTVPNGNFNARIAEFDEESSRSGLLMFVVEYRIEAPERLKGKGVTERFVIGKRPFDVKGNDSSEEFLEYAALDDPEADEELTWIYSRDFRKFKERCLAANWDGALEDAWDRDRLGEIVGLGLGLKIVEEIQEDGKYAGRTQNVVVYSYPLGDVEAALEETAKKVQKGRPGGNKGGAGRSKAHKPRNRAATKAARDYDEEEDEVF